MQRLDIKDKTLRVYGGENQDVLLHAIVLKEIKGFKLVEVESFLTALTLFTQWGEVSIRVKHEEANCLINRLSDVLEDNRVQIPELTGDTMVVKVNRHLSSEEKQILKNEMEDALKKQVIVFDKSIEIIGSINRQVQEELSESDEDVSTEALEEETQLYTES